jgi:DoxX-like family
MSSYAVIAQLIIAASVIGVWVFRLENVEREFVEYRLPPLIRNLVGATKTALATLLIVGIWYPPVVFGAAVMMAVLMACALYAHFHVRHKLVKYLPAATLLALSVFVADAARSFGPR